MQKYAVIGSGSCGNSYIFKTGSSCFVVDNGYSFSEFSRRAGSMGFDVSSIRYIFLTHNHRDHISGVESLSRKLKIPVFVSEKLDLSDSVKKGFYGRIDVRPGHSYSVDDFSFSVFSTFHDAPAPVGYSFSFGGKNIIIITDTGKTSDFMSQLASKSDIIFIEANYSPDMLANGPYPDFLRRRIFSDRGHLSNYDALRFLQKLDCGRKRVVYLCHISDKNNSPEVIKSIFDSGLPVNYKYYICRRGVPVQGIPGGFYEEKSACPAG